MEAILITIGLFVRTIQLLLPGFSKIDVANIFIAIVAGLFLAGKAGAILAFPFGFALIIALFYKNKILPTITEGTLFLYAVVATYIAVRDIESFSALSSTYLILLLFLSLYVLVGFYLCVTKTKVPSFLQIILMVFFLSNAIYIAYQSSLVFLITDSSPLTHLLIGYFGLYFISHILYILALIPLPGKHQSFKDRMKEVRKHAQFLEKKYSDKDINIKNTLGLVAVIILAFSYNYFYNDWITSVVLLLIIGGYLAAPNNFKLLSK